MWHYKRVLGMLHDSLADASGFGVDTQGVVDSLLRRPGTGGLSHVQGAPIGAAEGSGDALLCFEDAANGVPTRGLVVLRGAIGVELELSGEHLVDAPAQHRPGAWSDGEVSSQIEQGALSHLRADALGAHEAEGEVGFAGA